jgi:hypothetical protein
MFNNPGQLGVNSSGGDLFMLATSFALTVALVALAQAEPDKSAIDLSGSIDGRGLVLAECEKPVFKIQLTAKVDRDGEGKGTLVLDPTPPAVDEFGLPEVAAAPPVVKLECSLKFLKSKKIPVLPAVPAAFCAPDAEEAECRLYEITGPKITSRLTLAVDFGSWMSARLIVSDKDGKNRVMVPLHAPPRQERQQIPCHPGCFPAGTKILIPGGAKAVEDVRTGDVVTTVGPDGKAGTGKVTKVFTTTNRLFEVKTEGGTLTTTDRQPLALEGGGLRPAGELKEGDKLYSWDGKERKAVAVKSVTATGREAKVFNMVLGEPKLFVAGGFLARSKPPAPAADPAK